MTYVKKMAKKFGAVVDKQMLTHIGYLFSRDALVVFDDQVDDNDPKANHCKTGYSGLRGLSIQLYKKSREEFLNF